MAEAKTIKRRGFLKALPLAGMAVSTPAVALPAVAVEPNSHLPDDVETLARKLATAMADLHGGQRFASHVVHEHGFVLINRIYEDKTGARA